MDLISSRAIDQFNFKFQSLREHPDQNILTDLGIDNIIIIIIIITIIIITITIIQLNMPRLISRYHKRYQK